MEKELDMDVESANKLFGNDKLSESASEDRSRRPTLLETWQHWVRLHFQSHVQGQALADESEISTHQAAPDKNTSEKQKSLCTDLPSPSLALPGN